MSDPGELFIRGQRFLHHSACFAGNFRRRGLKTRCECLPSVALFDGVCMLTMAAIGDRLTDLVRTGEQTPGKEKRAG